MKNSLIAIALIIALFGVYLTYFIFVTNPKVADELKSDPNGERAKKVMLLTFESGKQIPVNYLLEDNKVYVGADFVWWKTFRGDGAPVELLIKGETVQGHARVVLDNKTFRDDIFSRLRPTVPTWLPEWLKAKLIVISRTPPST